MLFIIFLPISLRIDNHRVFKKFYNNKVKTKSCRKSTNDASSTYNTRDTHENTVFLSL